MICSALSLLGGCSALPSSINPVEWWHGLQGGAIAEQRPPPPGADQAYPNLASVPEKPKSADLKMQKQIADSLVADRTNAHYAATTAPLPDPSSPTASPALFGRGTVPPPAPPTASDTAGASLAAATAPPAPPAAAPAAPPPLPTSPERARQGPRRLGADRALGAAARRGRCGAGASRRRPAARVRRRAAAAAQHRRGAGVGQRRHPGDPAHGAQAGRDISRAEAGRGHGADRV